MQENIRQGIVNLGLIEERIKPEIMQLSHFTKNLQQLRFLLENKNRNFENNKKIDTRLSVRAMHDLKNKGANIEKLEREVQYEKKFKEKEKELKKDAEQCYFYVSNLNINNYQEFIVKNFEYSTCNNIQYAMGYNHLGKQMKSKLVEKLRSKKMRAPNRTIEYQSNILLSTASNRNQKIRKKYNTIIKQMVESKGKLTPYELLKQIGMIDKSSLINLVTRQFYDINFQEPNEITAKKKLMKNSVKIMEDQFAKKISNGKELYLKVQYLNRTQFKKLFVFTDSKNRPIWGLVYLNFRAGHYDEIRRLPHDSDCDIFFNDFNHYLQDGQKFKNRFAYPNQDIDDLFLEQLYAILNNTQQLRNEIIFNNRQLLWLGLKTIDIQSDIKYNDMTLEELQAHISSSFIKDPNTQTMQNLILSLNYDFAIKENTGILDIDDRIHLAIVLKMYKFKGLLNPQFYNQYVSMIKTYSQQMLQYDFQTSLYYTLMIHNKTDKDYNKLTLQTLEQLLINHNKVEQYFGLHPKDDTKYQRIVNNYLNLTTQKEQYINFISKVATNYQKRYGKYAYAALLYNQLLQNPTKSVECIIDLEINCILELTKPDINEKLQSRKQIQKYLREKRVQDMYKNTLGFLEYFMELSELLSTKNNKKISEKLMNNKYIVSAKNSSISNEIQQILNILNNRKGLKIYLLFLKAIIKAYQIHYSFKDDKASYNAFFSNFQSFFKNIKNNSVFVSNSSSLKSLLNQITSLLDQKIIFSA